MPRGFSYWGSCLDEVRVGVAKGPGNPWESNRDQRRELRRGRHNVVGGGEWRLAGVWAAFSTSYGEAAAVRLFLCHTYAPTPMAADMAISNRIQLSNAANQNISGKSWIRVSERGNNHVSPTKKR